MTKASWYIFTLIYPFTGPATNHCPKNGLSHLRIMECPNVHIISLQLITHRFYANEWWLIATELYKRIPTSLFESKNPYKWVCHYKKTWNGNTEYLVMKKFQTLWSEKKVMLAWKGFLVNGASYSQFFGNISPYMANDPQKFWYCGAKFGSSRCFCWDHEGDELHLTVRCQDHLMSY